MGGENICGRQVSSNYLLKENLYTRISRVGNPSCSVIPVLQKWVQEGKIVKKWELQNFIKEFRKYRRHKHALQISEWMDSQRGLKLSLSDYAIRLDLIAKVHGIASAEKFFADLPQVAKIQPTYGALLNAYVNERLTEKVEAHMKRMEDLGFTMTALPYNELLTLYKNVGMFEKVPLVIQEMKKNNVLPDKFTYNIQMSTCAAMSDIDGTEKVFEEMEHNPIVNTDWTTYANLANIYIKAGHPDKAQSALKRMEIKMKRRDRIAYNYLITLYTSVGDKDGVSRAWESLKLAFPKLTNLSFICMLCSFVKLGDLEGAEKCFQEWECAGLSYDFRVPNILLDAYMKKGLFEKAELFLEHALEKGVTPIPKTWEIFVEGYLEKWQIDKAIEAMKKAIASVEQGEWRPKSTNVLVILKYFEEQGDVEGAEWCLKILRAVNH
eukprot:Gb_09452 [translate_table: standard]